MDPKVNEVILSYQAACRRRKELEEGSPEDPVVATSSNGSRGCSGREAATAGEHAHPPQGSFADGLAGRAGASLRSLPAVQRVIALQFHVLTNMCNPLPALNSVAAGRFASLYTYLQLLGFFWFLFVVLFGAVSTHLMYAAAEGLQMDDTPRLLWPVRITACLYVYIAVVRIFILFIESAWTVMWEKWHDFPTLRRMMQHKGRPGGGVEDGKAPPANEAQPSEDAPFARQASPATIHSKGLQVLRKQIAMTTPLIVIFIAALALVLGQWACDGSSGDICGSLRILDCETRANRTLWAALWISAMQWNTVWKSVFPRYNVALATVDAGIKSVLCIVMLLVLTPLSGLCVMGIPLGLGQKLFGPMLTSWMCWSMLAASCTVDPRMLKPAGFSLEWVEEDQPWAAMCSEFRHCEWIFIVLYFSWTVMTVGFVHAQTDLVYITVYLPIIFTLVWIVVYALVTAARWGRVHGRFMRLIASVFFFCVLASFLVCKVAGGGRVKKPALVFLVSLHIIQRVLQDLKKRSSGLDERQRALRRNTVQFSVKALSSQSLSVSTLAEHRLMRSLFSLLIAICATFASVLVMLLCVGTLQQHLGFFWDNTYQWKVDRNGMWLWSHDLSFLGLLKRVNASEPATHALRPGEPGTYGVCHHALYGLTVLDYALLAEASYLDSADERGLAGYLRHVFPNRAVRLVRGEPGKRWLQFEVNPCQGWPGRGALGRDCKPFTVISIAGVQPTVVMDYAECLRMWTEPTGLSMLAMVFPTVRWWPRETSSFVIKAAHAVLESFAISDRKFEYSDILEHVRQMPKSRQVVLTGHSLGGGMALTVGALSGHYAVAFQPPGVFHSLAKHQAMDAVAQDVNAVHRQSITTVFEHDWVGTIFDSHGGLLQTMPCDHSESLLGCHMLEGMVCHLLRHCGDPEGRFAGCKHIYSPRSITASLLMGATRMIVGEPDKRPF